MVLRKRKFSVFDIDRIFDLVEEQIRRSLELTRRMFERFEPEIEEYEGYRTPLADIIDQGDKYLIEVELPGMKRDDIEIYTYNHTLEIIARRKLEKREEREGYLRLERAYAGFRRVFTLPSDADLERIKAKYENGVLRIEIPKLEGKGRKKVKIE